MREKRGHVVPMRSGMEMEMEMSQPRALPPTNTLGGIIRSLTAKKGLTQKELADRVFVVGEHLAEHFGDDLEAVRRFRKTLRKGGLSAAYFSRIMNDEPDAFPGEIVIMALAIVLDTDPDDLMIKAKKLPLDVQHLLKQYPTEFVPIIRHAEEIARRPGGFQAVYDLLGIDATKKPAPKPEGAKSEPMKECPDCICMVPTRAKVCRYCQHDF